MLICRLAGFYSEHAQLAYSRGVNLLFEFFLRSGFEIKIFEISVPARLKVLLGEVQVMVTFASSSFNEVKTLCCPSKIKSL